MLRLARSRVARVVAVGLIALAIPAAALGIVSPFADVPVTSQYFDSIRNVYNARITGGCGGGNYCPSDPVSREQMAAFLARTGGRVGTDIRDYDNGIALDHCCGVAAQVIATVTIRPGGVTGGTAFVVLMANVQAENSIGVGDTVPARAEFWIREQGNTSKQVDGSQGNVQVDTVVSGSTGRDSGSVTAVIPVATGATRTFELVAAMAGPSRLIVWGTLTSMYVPFSENGDNILD